MKRIDDEGTSWEFEIHDELVVAAARHGIEVVLARLTYDEDAPTLRLAVAEYRHEIAKGASASVPPLAGIEAYANQARHAVELLDRRETLDTKFVPMVISGAKAPGKKPNAFYAWVLIHKRTCDEAGIHYAERIAKDNHVTAAVVHRWVAEAKRRGISIDDDEVGQVRINGEPMDFSGEPMDTTAPLRAGR